MKYVPDNQMRARYRKIRVNGKQVSLHRHIAENKIGRHLLPNEVVHHINGNKLDNRPENLEVMDVSEHSRLENIGRTPSEETRAKLSAASKGRKYPGKVLTQEHKDRISKTMKIVRSIVFWSTKK